MRTKIASMILSVGFVAALAAWCVLPSRVNAQAKPTAQTKPAARPLPAKQPVIPDKPPREVTMTGRIVSLHAYMTGQSSSPDQAKSAADNIRAGIPAALDSPTGLILLGQGTTGVARILTPLAFQEVEVHGKLYEKGPMKYIDIITVEAAAADEEEDDEGADE